MHILNMMVIILGAGIAAGMYFLYDVSHYLRCAIDHNILCFSKDELSKMLTDAVFYAEEESGNSGGDIPKIDLAIEYIYLMSPDCGLGRNVLRSMLVSKLAQVRKDFPITGFK